MQDIHIYDTVTSSCANEEQNWSIMWKLTLLHYWQSMFKKSFSRSSKNELSLCTRMPRNQTLFVTDKCGLKRLGKQDELIVQTHVRP